MASDKAYTKKLKKKIIVKLIENIVSTELIERLDCAFMESF